MAGRPLRRTRLALENASKRKNAPREDWPGPNFISLVGPLAEMAPGNAYILSERFHWYRPVGGWPGDEGPVSIIGWNYPSGRSKRGRYTVGVWDDANTYFETTAEGIVDLEDAEALAERNYRNLHGHAVWNSPAYKRAFKRYVLPGIVAIHPALKGHKWFG